MMPGRQEAACTASPHMHLLPTRLSHKTSVPQVFLFQLQTSVFAFVRTQNFADVTFSCTYALVDCSLELCKKLQV